MCFLTTSFSEQRDQALLRRAEATKGHVAPALVIEPQIARKPALPLLGVLEGHPIGPFTAQGLDEPFGFAVGAGRVWLGPDRPEIQSPAGVSPCS